jgi:hypothetical protein
MDLDQLVVERVPPEELMDLVGDGQEQVELVGYLENLLISAVE